MRGVRGGWDPRMKTRLYQVENQAKPTKASKTIEKNFLRNSYDFPMNSYDFPLKVLALSWKPVQGALHKDRFLNTPTALHKKTQVLNVFWLKTGSNSHGFGRE